MDNTSIDPKAEQLAYHAGVGRAYHAPEIVHVVRRTPTQVVCKTRTGQEVRFHIKDGCQVGGRYGARADPVTPEVMDEIQRYRYAGAIQSKCYAIEDAVRKLAHHPRKEQAAVALQSVILKQLNEQLALLGDWTKALDGPDAAPSKPTTKGTGVPPIS